MEAMRCEQCGDVRWSLLGFAGRELRCELCSGAMVPERRQPHCVPTPTPPAERRDSQVRAQH